MGWFDKQIRQRMESDQQVLEDAFFDMARIVMDKWSANQLENSRLIAKQALDEILKYYHEKPVDVPSSIDDEREQMEYVLRPSGLMTRDVELEKNWQNNAYGPMLGYLKDSGTTVALIPDPLLGYRFLDPSTGKKTRVTKHNAKRFSSDAICFYKPLPIKSLGIPDLIIYLKNCVSAGDIVLILIASLAVTLVGMIEPRIYSVITGSVLSTGNTNLLIGLGVFLVCSAFASQLISLVRGLLTERINLKTSQSVEAAVMMRVLSLPVSFFRKYSSGELTSRAGSVKSLCSMLMDGVLSVGISSLVSLLYVRQISAFAPALVIPSVFIIIATVALSVISSLVQMGVSRKRMKFQAQETGITYALFNGMQKIRLSGSEKRVFARWANAYSKTAALDYNPPVFLKVNSVIIAAVSLIGTIVLYFLAVKSGVDESQYYAFSAAYGRVMGAFQALAGIAISVAGIKPVLEMAEPILKAEPEVASDKLRVDKIRGRVEVNNVSFRYDENGPYVLEKLNLNIKPGEYVAIVGRTGCGKSTLVRLLLGFEKPELGAIYYDNYDLANVDPRSLRKNIGVVIQNGQLFQGDIYSNITISAPNISRDDAWEAARMAGIADDIKQMPMGMNTYISEGQGGISGGQKQRLMIARAIAPKPKLIILDEATSALDNKTQKQVAESLDKLKCTRIVIAHRLSTIRNCDRILVMDEGRIIEEGTYDQLIENDGEFARLVERQRLDA